MEENSLRKFRRNIFILAQNFSIGFSSGEYGRRNINVILREFDRKE